MDWECFLPGLADKKIAFLLEGYLMPGAGAGPAHCRTMEKN
jgi:hypothetical protein